MPSAAAVQPRPVPTSAVPPLPEMVTCERRAMKLTATGCAKLFLSAAASRPERWEGRAACVACPVGAARAGKPLAAAEIAGERLRGVCTRCQEPHDRLICEGRFCPNCYNRDREHRLGRNRKGGTPRLQLRSVRMLVQPSAGLPEVRTETRVTGATEAMLLTAKRSSGGAILFGVPPAKLPDLPEPKPEEALPAPLCTDPHGMAAGGTPGSSPNEGAGSHLDVEASSASGKPPTSQVRREAAIGSRRWLLQGATAYFPAARFTPAIFDALLPFREATLSELRT